MLHLDLREAQRGKIIQRGKHTRHNVENCTPDLTLLCLVPYLTLPYTLPQACAAAGGCFSTADDTAAADVFPPPATLNVSPPCCSLRPR